jgi:tRNA 2-thiocytidine biosynthesis protein TtcA
MMFSSKVEKKLFFYTKKAINEFKMIQPGDKVMICLSGGKDSYSLVSIMNLLVKLGVFDCSLFSFTLDQSQPGWDDTHMRLWLDNTGLPYEILKRDTYSIVKEKIPENKTYCSLCSRLRRGNIYNYAKLNGFDKIALGHHRDDLITTLLMSILYNGKVSSMPPKLRTDSKEHIVIRPFVYCQEADIIRYAQEQNFPIIPCNLCGSQDNLARVRVKKLIKDLSLENQKIPSNILHALSSIHPSQLMDKKLWDFDAL